MSDVLVLLVWLLTIKTSVKAVMVVDMLPFTQFPGVAVIGLKTQLLGQFPTTGPEGADVMVGVVELSLGFTLCNRLEEEEPLDAVKVFVIDGMRLELASTLDALSDNNAGCDEGSSSCADVGLATHYLSNVQ